MIDQPVARQRCASCERWSGQRQSGSQPGHVAVASETTIGLCQGGPWDGTERRARSACGHWHLWPQLAESSCTA